MIKKNDILKILEKKKIKYTIYEHEPFYTVEDSGKKRFEMKGAHTKNLFLKNKKNQFFLISCKENTKVDLKKFAKTLNIGNVSFTKEDKLQNFLGVNAGSVTPFGLLNDHDNVVSFFLDKNINEADKVNFHPLINTQTITINTKDFVNFIIKNKKKVNIFDFETYSLI